MMVPVSIKINRCIDYGAMSYRSIPDVMPSWDEGTITIGLYCSSCDKEDEFLVGTRRWPLPDITLQYIALQCALHNKLNCVNES